VPDPDDFLTVAGRRVRIRRADFDALLDASVIASAPSVGPSVWDGEIPLSQVPSEG
jgi:hypothetical protein